MEDNNGTPLNPLCLSIPSYPCESFFPLGIALLFSVSLMAQSAAPWKAAPAPELQRTSLINAVRAGQLVAARILISSGADANARDVNGVTALIEAADKGRPKIAALLISAGADVNVRTRGLGSALDAAERAGHQGIVAMLRNAGARTTGKSVGDKVCVRLWEGDGYCGTVERTNRNDFQIRITEIVGCAGGCPPRAECSAGSPVGGPDGIKVGDTLKTVSWCLTETGVRP
jgi:hypothetical protein